MRIIRRIIFQLLCLLGACCYIPATAQVVLVDNGKTKSRIILSENDQINQISANLFQLFLQRISGCTFPIVKGQNAKKGDIIISSKTPAGVTEDGFSLSYERWNLTYFRQWEWDGLRSCNFTRTISWSGLLGRKRILF